MKLLATTLPSPLQRLTDSVTKTAEVELYIKRDDLIHPLVSGNKWRKLKYALQEANERDVKTILTFGGAFSNHLFALSAAGKLLGFRTIGVVRGEELEDKERSSTLAFCEAQGMELVFVTRQEYKQRAERPFLDELCQRFDSPMIIAEGGTGPLALQGVAELTGEVREQLGRRPDYYALASGTGGTAAGILSAGASVLSFPVLKGGGFLEKDILDLAGELSPDVSLSLFTDFHFGGYGRWNTELLEFIDWFHREHHIQLEQIYTGKMMYGLYQLLERGYFKPGSSIVTIHTGGLQGLLSSRR
ncbi:1-aminocyclopropane-1-carboxylate deaminase/D-cysteine desulfhydrase-like pyridoxal-dependent ACC family enzyme [Dyadobacter jejuensis]|uniref:1-aminocyclopropane-1-carboxylate deaminase/D-cysteine desulfhydrase-like pyridoxal-dependent ACC family enzyme n=1 Tax=Dyadobacter jejuensis TaxID=1082580 RepID=A0A316AND6_9BACT|nr:pyridoxal-phosphate dependent enzyme [Dyadobacter jejuensis]PWJ59265.1 1-aminocyclopropane-1-carboxylate deaminase/D-cysteine desulfhydrase-like pyridoxal-dependent ACC family enzyme [Dyadobacter jejuensis]